MPSLYAEMTRSPGWGTQAGGGRQIPAGEGEAAIVRGRRWPPREMDEVTQPNAALVEEAAAAADSLQDTM